MKKNIIYIIPFAITAICIVAFNLIGSSVSPTGVLIEPFFLIPIGYLFFFIGLVLLLIKGVFSLIKKDV